MDYTESKQNEFQNILQLQELLLTINFDTNENIIVNLSNLNVLNSPHGIYLFVTNIFNMIIYRPLHHVSFAKFLKQMLDMHPQNYTLFKSFFFSQFRAIIDDPTSYPRNIPTILLFYDLFKIQFLSIEESVSMLKEIWSDACYIPTESSILLFFYFSKELNSADIEFYDYILSIIINSEERALSPEIHDSIDLIHDLFNNNFRMLEGWRNSHCIPDSLAHAILKDNVEVLQTIIETEKLTVDTTIPPNIFFISSIVMNNPTLLQFSAFFNSIECFKYLLANQANTLLIDDKHRNLAQFAVAGGNEEIIELLQQNNVSFNRSLSLSLEYHHHKLFEMILHKFYDGRLYEDSIPIPIVKIALQSNNAHIIEYIQTKKLKSDLTLFNNFEEMWLSYLNGFIVTLQTAYPKIQLNTSFLSHFNRYSLLHYAVIRNYVSIIPEILTTNNINVNILDDYGKTPFYLAIENGFINSIKILKDNDAEINRRPKNNLAPIHAAIRNNQVEIVSLLLEWTPFDLNMKDAISLFLFCFNMGIFINV